MVRALISIAVMLAGVAMTLAAAGAILLMTNSIEEMGNGIIRGLAIAAALCLGVLLLVTSVFISVKLAVLFGVRPGEEPPTAQIDVNYLRQTKNGK